MRKSYELEDDPGVVEKRMQFYIQLCYRHDRIRPKFKKILHCSELINSTSNLQSSSDIVSSVTNDNCDKFWNSKSRREKTIRELLKLVSLCVWRQIIDILVFTLNKWILSCGCVTVWRHSPCHAWHFLQVVCVVTVQPRQPHYPQYYSETEHNNYSEMFTK